MQRPGVGRCLVCLGTSVPGPVGQRVAAEVWGGIDLNGLPRRGAALGDVEQKHDRRSCWFSENHSMQLPDGVELTWLSSPPSRGGGGLEQGESNAGGGRCQILHTF